MSGWVRYMASCELPPRPDPGTGLPRPPHAPAYVGDDTPADRDPYRARGRPPSPPPGQGPVLAWYRASRRGALTAAAFAFALIAFVIILGTGTDAITFWPIWAISLIGSLGVYSSVRVGECSVGASWLASRKRWVDLYDLVKVTCHSNRGDSEIRFVDSAGRRLELSLSDLHGDRTIWDYTYNGILHSVISGGAQTNGMLHM